MTSIRKQSSRVSLNGGGAGITTYYRDLSTTSRSARVVQLFRIVLLTIYLILIVLTIPLSFELGGINCGLSFTFTILVLYFVLTTFRVWRFNRVISSFLYYSQHLLLPSLLFTFISLFSNSDYHIIDDENIVEKIWWNFIIKYWRSFLVNATPLFTILEGFCSLLLIQSIGQTSKWLAKHKSETWSIVSLLSSGMIITLATFFLFKIYVSPINITNIGLISASLLGSILTFTLVVTSFGLLMGKSTTIESSLIFAYIVKSIYEIFPELSQLNYDNFQDLIKFVLIELNKINKEAKNKSWFLINNEFDFAKLSPIFNSEITRNSIYNFYQVILKFTTRYFPNSFSTLWDFLKLSVINLTVPIILNLFYRIGVFFALTKIIPILQPLSSSPNRSPILSQQSSPKLSPVTSYLPRSPSTTSVHSIKESDINLSSSSIASSSSSSDTSSQPLTKSASVSSFNNYVIYPHSKTTKLIYLYSPCIIIMVYTNLMIQYNNSIEDIPLINWLIRDFLNDGVHIWQFWHWVNVFLFLMLYTIELVLN